MLERLVETFCAVDDFCQAFMPQWEAYLLGTGTAPRGPQPGLVVSEIITILLVLHGSQFKYLNSFYTGVVETSQALRCPWSAAHSRRASLVRFARSLSVRHPGNFAPPPIARGLAHD